MAATSTRSESLIKDIQTFVENFDKPGSVYHQYKCLLSEDQKKDVERQVQSMPADIEKMCNGKLSYSQMRMMYG